MRFQVPQFIEVEDKIFGQLTLRQFIYLAGGAGLSFLVYTLIGSLVFAAIPILIIMASVAALSFYRFNNRPFIDMLEAAVKYWARAKLFIWKKEAKPKVEDAQAEAQKAKEYASVMVPKISDSRLKELSWSLDVKESAYPTKDPK